MAMERASNVGLERAGRRTRDGVRKEDDTSSALPFQIAGVWVDKPEVCRGERTVVRVRATHAQGNAAWLVPSINGRVGWAVSVIAPDSTPGKYQIPVRLGDPDRRSPGQRAAYRESSASIVLKDCDTPASLWLTSTQPFPNEEVVWLRATRRGPSPDPDAPSRLQAWYVWDFGDGSPKLRTKNPEARHLFPNEEERGPGQRVFTYLVKAELFDQEGRVLADGALDFTLRNRLEELKYTDHRLQLRSEFQPHPRIDSDGASVIDVVLKNLDGEETADLTGLDLHQLPCSMDGPSRIDRRAIQEVFDAGSVPPRGAIAGRLRWPKDAAADVCNLDVSIHGTSRPSGLTVGATFSMRLRLDQGVDVVSDRQDTAEIRKAMTLIDKPYVTLDDLVDLIASGQISESALQAWRLPPSRKNAR